MKFFSRFIDKSRDASNVAEYFDDLGRLAEVIHEHAPKFDRWYLTGETKEDALLYSAFEHWKPTTAALAVVRTERGSNDYASISLWDGGNEEEESASLSCVITPKDNAKEIEADFVNDQLFSMDSALAIASTLIQLTSPSYLTVQPYGYFEKQVFDDKPGVGWMLYLPKVITQQQVPEARALIPVPAKGKQTGTIIVSVTDAPFSVDNPEHVAIANRIEIRLVDQDLLPAYVDI
ncbi:immunity 52 family protein [Burkholderia sp. ABCPW 111]|uniref:immunity 52 family protein n=1 Tax=Burkholderia sp. ABCPW 111 TaxID=1820025 RepID=UPI0005314D56|nr:immunity 52 family protein [Burkholderia sp. ABCPW 111]KGR93235.1 immunity 32 family protein [Burkholderia sp. ABCPW 111]